ncbi:MAG: hypothetical protein ACRDNK_21445 [Solirubrobacteraceae bacterium]
MKRAWVALVAVALLAGFAVGSAGTTNTTNPPPAWTAARPTTLTKAQYIGQANAVCASFDRSILALRRTAAGISLRSRSDLPRLVPPFRQAEQLVRHALQRVAALVPPRRDEPVVKRWIQAVRRNVDLARQAIAAASQRDSKGLRAVIKQSDENGLASARASRASGLTVCANGG